MLLPRRPIPARRRRHCGPLEDSLTTTLHRTRQLWESSAYLVAGAVVLGGYLVVDHPFGIANSVPKDVLGSVIASIVLFGLVAGRLADVSLGQRKALRHLELARSEQQKLLARTLEVAEHERMRVAIDLHDGPIQ